ncbi:unnamed protein product [Rotaria sordida]|uniref:Uncharacterized protein n=1 Tax=Rotaria sordida TaxID=392033 RepID=A0A819C0B8_9BILA|nr:unnamed protein product [Rotaria sordida]
MQILNSQWATTVCSFFETNQTTQRNKYLQLCHQLQFTLSTNNTSSIFLKQHVDRQQWKDLTDWIQLNRHANPPTLELKGNKVMLLLNIYYDYYCNNQLTFLNTLLPLIESMLQSLPGELRVFRAFLQPEQFMIGYSRENDNADKDFLNSLFRVDCKDEDELCIHHSLVNLLVMFLMGGGKQIFLWTFAFHPLTLQNKFGFASPAYHSEQWCTL